MRFLATFAFASSLFAFSFDQNVDSNYSLKGNWVDAAGEKGTWTSTVNIKLSAEDPRTYTITESLKTSNGFEQDMTHTIVSSAGGFFKITDEHGHEGEGYCVKKSYCRYAIVSEHGTVIDSWHFMGPIMTKEGFMAGQNSSVRWRGWGHKN